MHLFTSTLVVVFLIVYIHDSSVPVMHIIYAHSIRATLTHLHYYKIIENEVYFDYDCQTIINDNKIHKTTM